MVFDAEQGTVQLVIHGPSWCNMHPQYCRSLDPEASHDILIQENHGNVATATGGVTRLTGGEVNLQYDYTMSESAPGVCPCSCETFPAALTCAK